MKNEDIKKAKDSVSTMINHYSEFYRKDYLLIRDFATKNKLEKFERALIPMLLDIRESNFYEEKNIEEAVLIDFKDTVYPKILEFSKNKLNILNLQKALKSQSLFIERNFHKR